MSHVSKRGSNDQTAQWKLGHTTDRNVSVFECVLFVVCLHAFECVCDAGGLHVVCDVVCVCVCVSMMQVCLLFLMLEVGLLFVFVSDAGGLFCVCVCLCC